MVRNAFISKIFKILPNLLILLIVLEVFILGTPEAMSQSASTGTLFGVGFNESTNTLFSIDPVTAERAIIRSFPGINGIAQGTSAYDTTNHRIFIPQGGRLFVVDTQTGEIVANPAFEGLPMLEFDPDTIAPANITNLHNITYAQTYINWTWTDSEDADFNKVMIYLDESFQTNVTKGVQYYNATGLTAGSTHTIATRTVDSSGNINLTWVNHTATTLYIGGGGELRGDVNRNGIRDTGDATVILRFLVELPTPSEYLPILPIGDMNCNGIIDTGDATLILRDIVGLDIPRCWE